MEPTELLSTILTNVLTALYQPFWFSLMAAVLFMFVYRTYRSVGVRGAVRQWAHWFHTEQEFRRLFLLAFFTVMILFRTLLNRNMWANPISNVIGIWGFTDSRGEFTTEAVENILLFLPFTPLLLWALEKRLVAGRSFLGILWSAVKTAFLFSLSIEFLQLFLRLGTWQLSDLFQNTVGGLLGGMIYAVVHKVHQWKRAA